ncbi:T9SS type A sorting domain-containing protein [Polaribacter septentrionalilitoris]|uniref:T9SS type A sorting domain-containing protein n=1 Tax=Polaribacter septentrionalilitoris TaxID=2494657 RepID=UPI001359814D|nr:T9SS type A sorting domain-containing protein [Polaribacter septentrionalilitoris]
MKKITLFSLFLISALTINAQKTYDFSGSANPGTWQSKGSSISATPSADGMVLEFGAGTPRLDITRAADPFNVSEGAFAVVTLTNNSTEIENFRLQYDKNASGKTGIQYMGWTGGITPAATAGNGVQQTLVFPLTSANYQNDGGGTGSAFANDTDGKDNMEYIAIAFRNASASNLTEDSATNGNIIIQKIEIVNPGVFTKDSYNFASDSITGFDVNNAGAATVSYGGSTINFNGDGTKKAPKISQTFYGVNASSNTHVHIVVDSNASNADEIKFQFVDATDAVQTYGVQTLNSGSQTTIDFDLSTKTEWTGNITDWRIVFTESSDANIDTGTIAISEIIFDSNASLSTPTFNDFSFSVYPNPTNGILHIKSSNNLQKIQLFSILGKKVFESKLLTNKTLNLSQVNAGVYLLRLIDANNNTKTQKLILN